jgi:NAD(P)-dependent dehydrogenase (short-subunit alcohol dehydrogenase family)
VVRVKDLFNLEGKVAVVTGGATGIGRQLAHGLGEMGAQLVLCSRNFERCSQVAKEFKGEGISTIPFRCDVTKTEEINQLVERCLQEFGKIDILVNNAGSTWGAPAVDMRPENWAKVISVNLMGAVNASQLVGREMMKREKGNIINVTSVTGFVGSDPKTQDAIAYNTSKGALLTFTKDLAVKWVQYGIRVNAIAPGWFPTKLSAWQLENFGEAIKENIPMKRFGFDHELKGAVVFLASEASSYVTGHILVVDGGFMAW